MDSNNNINNTSNNKNYSVKVAWIGGICVVIAAIIGIFQISFNIDNKLKDEYEKLKTENLELKTQLNDLREQYNELENEYSNLEKEYNILDKENSSLDTELKEHNSEISQYESLLKENESLKEEVKNLQNELQELANNYNNQSENNSDELKPSHSGKKISIFTLDTFSGYKNWNLAENKTFYTDTYNNEYIGAYYSVHRPTTMDDDIYISTYLLNYEYSICEGKIAWAKEDKNLGGNAWIEFYSENECIYTTEPISANSKALEFSFSVEGIEKLTIIMNSSGTKPYIIYPYLNLVE